MTTELVILRQSKIVDSQTILFASHEHVVTAATHEIFLHDLETLQIKSIIPSIATMSQLVLDLSQRFLAYSTEVAPDSFVPVGTLFKKIASSVISYLATPTPCSKEERSSNIAFCADSGNVIVRDLYTDNTPAHFRAHSNPISAIAINPNQTLLVTASVAGTSFLVWEIPGLLYYNSRQCNSVPCLYKLGGCFLLFTIVDRGYTPAIVQEIAFSVDSRIIIVTTARQTRHVYSIDPIPSSRSPPKPGSREYSLGIVNGLIDTFDEPKQIPAIETYSKSHDSAADLQHGVITTYTPIARIKPLKTEATHRAVTLIDRIDGTLVVYTVINTTLALYRLEFGNGAVRSPPLSSSPRSPTTAASSTASPIALLFQAGFPTSPIGGGGVKVVEVSELQLAFGKLACAALEKANAKPSTTTRSDKKRYCSKRVYGNSWIANIEISTFNGVAFGLPLWLEHDWAFHIFKSSDNDDDDSDTMPLKSPQRPTLQESGPDYSDLPGWSGLKVLLANEALDGRVQGAACISQALADRIEIPAGDIEFCFEDAFDIDEQCVI